MTNMHVIQDGLDANPNHFDQILKNQCRQIHFVTCLDLMHEPIVNQTNSNVLQPYGSKEM